MHWRQVDPVHVVGALLLALEGDFSATWLGALLAFGAPLAWSLGSYASRKLELPAPAMAASAQWLVGGALFSPLGAALSLLSMGGLFLLAGYLAPLPPAER